VDDPALAERFAGAAEQILLPGPAAGRRGGTAAKPSAAAKKKRA
jgi:hypothetical protein